jgi:hypothetical protein
MIERLTARALEPRDAAGLAVFRMLFGLLCSYGALRFLVNGWVDRFFVAPRFFFKYWGFEWVAAGDRTTMIGVFVAPRRPRSDDRSGRVLPPGDGGLLRALHLRRAHRRHQLPQPLLPRFTARPSPRRGAAPRNLVRRCLAQPVHPNGDAPRLGDVGLPNAGGPRLRGRGPRQGRSRLASARGTPRALDALTYRCAVPRRPSSTSPGSPS